MELTKEELSKKEDITKQEQQFLVDNFPHIRPDYGKKSYRLQSSQGILTVAGVIMGCGLAQMFGVMNIYSDKSYHEAEEVLEQIKEDWKGNCGAIICTLGKSYRRGENSCEKYVLKLGFVEIAEYPNFHHNKTGEETQKLYILKLQQ